MHPVSALPASRAQRSQPLPLPDSCGHIRTHRPPQLKKQPAQLLQHLLLYPNLPGISRSASLSAFHWTIPSSQRCPSGQSLLPYRRLSRRLQCGLHPANSVLGTSRSESPATSGTCPLQPSCGCGFIVGNKRTSRMEKLSVSSITSRSIPIPMPPVGGIP